MIIRKLFKKTLVVFGLMVITLTAQAQNKTYINNHKVLAVLLSKQYGIPASLILAVAAIDLANVVRIPLVQTNYTDTERELDPEDVANILRFNGASNAIEVSIDGSLLWAFEAASTAFVCQAKVISVAGGPLTFVGTGGITTISYYGKNPGSVPYAAGDYLTIVVDSATTASIFCEAVIP